MRRDAKIVGSNDETNLVCIDVDIGARNNAADLVMHAVGDVFYSYGTTAIAVE